MAYTKKYMLEESLKAIKENKLFFIDDIFGYVDFCKATFYNKKLEQLDALKKEISKNRIQAKQSLKAKWHKSDNPTLQVALHKLIGTEEEYHRLANTKQAVDHTTQGEKLQITVTPPIVVEEDEEENEQRD